MSNVDGGYSANSQELTFIESDFVGAENTQASEFNYDLTFPNDQNNFQTQTQHSQLDHMMSQTGGGIGLSNQVRLGSTRLPTQHDQASSTEPSYCLLGRR